LPIKYISGRYFFLREFFLQSQFIILIIFSLLKNRKEIVAETTNTIKKTQAYIHKNFKAKTGEVKKNFGDSIRIQKKTTSFFQF
jgi:hypothetical protein